MSFLHALSSLTRGTQLLARLLTRTPEDIEEVVTTTAHSRLNGKVSSWMGRLLLHAEQLELQMEDGSTELLDDVVFDPSMREALSRGQVCRLTLMSTERPDVASGEQSPLYFVLALRTIDADAVFTMNPRVQRLSAALAPLAALTLVSGIGLSLVQAHAAYAAVAVLAFIAMRYVWAQLPRQQVLDAAASVQVP